MKTSDFYYELPPELIAQTPLEQRDQSRLLVMDRETGTLRHSRFCRLGALLRPGDLLVLNDTRVLPARLLGSREQTGGFIEFLLLEQRTGTDWEILVRPGKRAKPGARFVFGGGVLRGEILEVLEGGNRLARFQWEGESFFSALERVGEVPLPHYITQPLGEAQRYQTVYARHNGSAAAPTAGLHFTPELLRQLEGQGVQTATVTLHVGLGTFRPVKAEDIAQHKMHAERYTLPPATADKINRVKAAGGRVIAVGTTSCRTLESVAQKHGGVVADTGTTDIFLYPGREFRVLDGLITNFHLPESTLIMLVAAFAGYANTMACYREAVEKRYRFYSFGDAMLIL